MSSVHAGVITFEDLPDAYFFSSGGQNIGSFYPGITFGPNVTALSVSRFGGYASDAFPPHSGDVVVWDASDPTITINFASPIEWFGIWYTSFDPLSLQAFDAGNNLLGTVVGAPNTDGSAGASSFLSFSGPAVVSVSFTSSPGLFTLDDLTAVPDPGTFGLLALSLVFLCLCRSVRRGARGFAVLFPSSGRGPAGVSPWRAVPAPGSRFVAALLLLLCLVAVAPGQSPLTIGAPADGKLTSPFSWCCTYQQVFSGAAFPGSVCHGDVCVGVPGYTISSLTFNGAGGVGAGNGVLYDAVYTITLSTTTTPVNALDTADLSKNIGFNSQTFYSAHLVGSIPNGQNLTFTGTPYTYYPQAGNLLVTISQTSVNLGNCISAGGGYWLCPPGITFDARSGTANGLFSSAYPNEAAGVGNNRGSVITFGVTPTVPPCTPPSVTSQPTSQSIITGSSAILSIAASGTAPQYQWYENNSLISGATGSSYNTGPLTSTTTYSATASNACGAVSSATATISVGPCIPVQISTQPQDTQVTSGDTATLNVTATGSSLQYQWYGGDNIPIPGQTSNTYTTGSLSADASFYVVITGPCGPPVKSRIAKVTVVLPCTPPSILIPPLPQSVAVGTGASLDVVANGSNLQYQWKRSGTVISGATGSTYTTPSLSSDTLFSVVVTNPCSAQPPLEVSALVVVNPLIGPPGTSLNPTGTFADPVNTATGSYTTSHVDISVKGRGVPFEFTRYYNSSDTYSGPIGLGWTHTYNAVLTENTSANTVSIKQGDGSQIVFSSSGTSYIPLTRGLTDTLLKNSDGSFTLLKKTHNQFVFSSNGRLLRITDRNGNTLTLSYDLFGELTEVLDTIGRTFSFSYDANRRLTSITDPANRIVRFVYTSNGDLTTYQDAAGGTILYGYDSAHRLVSGTDQRGVVYVQNTYDSLGRVTIQKNGRLLMTTFAYDTPSAGVTTITDSLGNSTKHVYDADRRLVQSVDGKGNATTYAYDGNNNRTTLSNANGNTSTFLFDSAGNIVSVKSPLGGTTRFTYDGTNNLTSSVAPSGAKSVLSYDSAGDLIIIEDQAGKKTSLAYDQHGQLISRTNALGKTWSYSYDSMGNLVKATDPLGQIRTFGYDMLGRLTSMTNNGGHTVKTTYDTLGRTLSRSDALGNIVSFIYDSVGNLLSSSDANGNTTKTEYDELNSLIKVTDAVGGITSYGYDGGNNRVRVTNARGKVTTYTYDVIGHLVKVVAPLLSTTSYTYDAVGNLLSTTDAMGKTHTFGYDALNRIKSRAYSDGTSISYTFDVDGNRVSMNDQYGQSVYAYDTAQRLVSVSNAKGRKVQYEYDDAGRLLSRTYPDGRVVTYGYDVSDRLASVRDWAGRITGYTYDVAGNLVSIAYPNGIISSYMYDDANRRIAIYNKSGTRVLSSFRYDLDPVGNRVRQVDTAGGVTQYQYDRINRLVSWTSPSLQATAYSYDLGGNRTSVLTSAGVTDYTYDDGDRLLTAGIVSYTYDAKGNQLAKKSGTATTAYSFDSLNRLVGVLSGSTAVGFQYDGDGNRIGITNSGVQTDLVVDTARQYASVLSETGPNGAVDYVYGGSLILASSSGFEQFYHHDGVGSTASVTDASGALKAGYSYDPWGRMINPIDPLGNKNPFKFAGEVLDAPTGLYYLRARYYDPSVGRFLSRDPLPGPFPMSTPTNAYTYALANPASLVDPTGLSAEPVSSLGVAPALPRALQSWASVFIPAGVLHGLGQAHVITTPLSASAAALRSAPGVYIGPAASGGNNSASGYSPYNTIRSTQMFTGAQFGSPWTMDDWNYVQERIACVPAAGDICIPSGGESPHTHEEQATLQDILNGIGETNSQTPVPDFAQPEFIW